MCNWFVVVPRPWTGRKGHVSEFGNRKRYGFGMTLQILARPCVCPTFVARSRPEWPTAYAVDAFGMCVSLLHLLEDFSAASSSVKKRWRFFHDIESYTFTKQLLCIRYHSCQIYGNSGSFMSTFNPLYRFVIHSHINLRISIDTYIYILYNYITYYNLIDYISALLLYICRL